MASRPKASSFLTLTEVLDAIDGFDDELQFREEDDTEVLDAMDDLMMSCNLEKRMTQKY